MSEELCPPLGPPYVHRDMVFLGGGGVLMSEVPLLKRRATSRWEGAARARARGEDGGENSY